MTNATNEEQMSVSKLQIMALLEDMARADVGDLLPRLEEHCHADVVWEVFHPFNTIVGASAAVDEFWAPLRKSFPDLEYRPSLVLAGDYQGESWVSTLGHVVGGFEHPWVGIPQSHAITFLRFGLNAQLTDGRIAKAFVYLDLIDVMRQVGRYPLRAMPGSAEQWPSPPIRTDPGGDDHERGQRSLDIVRRMQAGMGFDHGLSGAEAEMHSPLWHPHMNWFGPAGIGSTRGERGFFDYHCALFDQALPDATWPELYQRDSSGERPLPTTNHFIQLGDGPFAVTSGWPSLSGTHLGGGWLGMAPTGRRIDLRVADWYRVDADGLIIDNWVAIDLLHVLMQCGYDLLDDLRYLVHPTARRWPPRKSRALEQMNQHDSPSGVV